MVIIVPFVLPERILVQLDMGDPWEEADWSTIGNSVLFSAWMVSPVVFLVTGLLGVAKLLDRSVVNWCPAIVSGGIFAAITAFFGIRYWWAKKHEA